MHGCVQIFWLFVVYSVAGSNSSRSALHERKQYAPIDAVHPAARVIARLHGIKVKHGTTLHGTGDGREMYAFRYTRSTVCLPSCVCVCV